MTPPSDRALTEQHKLTVLSLFSGIGGIDLGLEMTGHFRTVAFCEIEAYPRKVLRKHWGAEIPIFEDVHDVTRDAILRAGIKRVDVIAGGFPCQDISIAGNQAGIKAGTRSGLWFEFARIIGDLRPRYVILENVAAITRIDGTRVIADLAQMGYDAQWATLYASDTGAPHSRERWFCVAYLSDGMGDTQGIGTGRFTRDLQSPIRTVGKSSGGRGEFASTGELDNANSPRSYARGLSGGHEAENSKINNDGVPPSLADTQHCRCEGRQSERDRSAPAMPSGSAANGNTSQSRLGRVFNGLPARMDGASWVARPNEPQQEWEPPRSIPITGNGRNHRIKALGNAVVPQVVAFVGECLWRFHIAHNPRPFALAIRPRTSQGYHVRHRAGLTMRPARRSGTSAEVPLTRVLDGVTAVLSEGTPQFTEAAETGATGACGADLETLLTEREKASHPAPPPGEGAHETSESTERIRG